MPYPMPYFITLPKSERWRQTENCHLDSDMIFNYLKKSHDERVHTFISLMERYSELCDSVGEKQCQALGEAILKYADWFHEHDYWTICLIRASFRETDEQFWAGYATACDEAGRPDLVESRGHHAKYGALLLETMRPAQDG